MFEHEIEKQDQEPAQHVEEVIMHDTLDKIVRVESFIAGHIAKPGDAALGEIHTKGEARLNRDTLDNLASIRSTVRFLATEAIRAKQEGGSWFMYLAIGLTIGFIIGGMVAAG